MNVETQVQPKRSIVSAKVIVIVVLIIGGAILWRAANNNRAAPPSAGFVAAFRQPQRVVDQRVALKEGSYVVYSFSLSTDARVQVQVLAAPESVNVLLMTPDDVDRFRKVNDDLFGGKYSYRRALSSKEVLRMDSTEALPMGQWAIVVQRPLEHILFHKNTGANVVVTVY
jgi:hypothetical protein